MFEKWELKSNGLLLAPLGRSIVVIHSKEGRFATLNLT